MILVDAMTLLYRANWKLQDLQTCDGRLTGMEFGFLKGVEALRRHFKDEVILCWEGRRNFRYEIDSEYKANRRKKRTDNTNRHLNFDRVKEFQDFLLMIAESATEPELEADDIIASLAERYCKTEPVVIFSSDKDLHQLLRDASPRRFVAAAADGSKITEWADPDADNHFAVSQLKDFQHRDKLWTPRRVEEKYYGLTPQQFKVFQAWAGDTIDNIPGCTRVRKSLIAAAIQKGLKPYSMSDFILFSDTEAQRIDAHVEPSVSDGRPDGGLGDSINSRQVSVPGLSRYEKNLRLVTLIVKPDIEVVQRNWDKEKISKWLYNMQFRSLKLCRECGLGVTINSDEEF
ncbi:hypothetical protein LCGC14_0377780 [marine sediment metagenome]|uniref:5'-3' exonuclease domain-containing protein n=1 Tax=marine sediment metagenome TaxID=412755 RepID=A0A0F9T2Z3_9ZZZZ